jgi:hypothetical protein
MVRQPTLGEAGIAIPCSQKRASVRLTTAFWNWGFEPRRFERLLTLPAGE